MGVDVLKKFKKEAVARKEHAARTAPGGPSVAAACSPVAGNANAPAQAVPKHEPAHRFFVSSNWKNLLEKKPTIAPKTAAAQPSAAAKDAAGPGRHGGVDIVALDCEMVGVGAGGTRSALARVSIVDHQGTVLVDKYVRPGEEITDYRTHVTGINSATLKAKGVWESEFAMTKAAELLKGRIVVGHAVHHDFQVLQLDHPHVLIRDTSTFRPLRVPGREKKTPSLALLCSHWLHEKIHEASHDSVEDARVALRLYNLKSKLWEKQMKSAMLRYLAGDARSGEDAEEDDGLDEEGEQVQREVFELQAMSSKRRNRRRSTVGAAAEVAAAMLAEHERKAKRRKSEEAAKNSSLPAQGSPSKDKDDAQPVRGTTSTGGDLSSTTTSANPGKKRRKTLAKLAAAAGGTSAKPAAGSAPKSHANPGKKKRQAMARAANSSAAPPGQLRRASGAKAAARMRR